MSPTRLRPTTLAAIALAGAASMATSPAFWGTSASAKLGTIELAPGAEVTRTILVVPEFEIATPAGNESWRFVAKVDLADTATASLAIALREGDALLHEGTFTSSAAASDLRPSLWETYDRPRSCAPCAGVYTLRVTNRSSAPVRLVDPEVGHESSAPFDFDLRAPTVQLLVAE